MTAIINVYGRAGRDGEIRTAKSGKEWASVPIAVTLPRREKGAETDGTVWVKVVAFGEAAERLGSILKGEGVTALGRLSQEAWTSPSGEVREGWSLIADTLLTGKGEAKAKPKPAAPALASSPAQQPLDADLADEIPF